MQRVRSGAHTRGPPSHRVMYHKIRKQGKVCCLAFQGVGNGKENSYGRTDLSNRGQLLIPSPLAALAPTETMNLGGYVYQSCLAIDSFEQTRENSARPNFVKF